MLLDFQNLLGNALRLFFFNLFVIYLFTLSTCLYPSFSLRHTLSLHLPRSLPHSPTPTHSLLPTHTLSFSLSHSHSLSLSQARENCKQQILSMRSDHTRAHNPTPYKISVSQQLYEFIHLLWMAEAPIADLS